MKLNDLFFSARGSDLDRNALEDAAPPEGVNYISRIGSGNGVSGRVMVPEGITPFPAGCLTVALGSRNFALATFLQPEPFVTGQNIQVLTPKIQMSVGEKLYWAACITANRFRYGFGRYANRTLGSLELPDLVPDWVVNGKSRLTSLLDGPSSEPIRESHLHIGEFLPRWSDFAIENIFDVRKGSRVIKKDRVAGKTPYISSSRIANGRVDYIADDPVFPAGSISVPYNGNVGYACLQPEPFCASDDVHVLLPPEGVSQASMLFVVAIIRAEQYRFSYGRKWNLERMRKSVLHLPAINDLQPDWTAMSRWIESRPFSKAALTNQSMI